MNITAKTPEEFALILEPFPFLDDDTKSRLVEKSKPFFEFLNFMIEKHNTTAEVIQARTEMMVNSKMAKKMVDIENSDSFMEDDTSDQVKTIMREIFDEIAAEEGFDGNLGDYAVELMVIQEVMEKHVAQLISEGKEKELENFINIMDKNI